MSWGNGGKINVIKKNGEKSLREIWTKTCVKEGWLGKEYKTKIYKYVNNYRVLIISF